MTKRQIEIFTADCPLCDETVRMVQKLACSNCEVLVYDLRLGHNQPTTRAKAEQYGVEAVPAIAINGALVLTGKPTQAQLLAVGVGQPLS